MKSPNKPIKEFEERYPAGYPSSYPLDVPIAPHPLADPLEHRIYLPDKRIIVPDPDRDNPNQPNHPRIQPYGTAPQFNARGLNGGFAY